MKKYVVMIVLLISSTICHAQIPIVSLVTGIVKKVIVAIDLNVQRLQNQTIALQNAQKAIENTLSLSKLNDISGWLNKEKDLYKTYYDELATVRSVISGYSTVRRMIVQQARLVSEYKAASALFNRDPHFTAGELAYMGSVYSGILDESVRNLDEVLTAVSAMQMSDGERIEAIRRASAGVQRNLDALRRFNHNNQQLSLVRSRNAADRTVISKLYGL